MSFKKYFILSLLEGKLDDVKEKHYDLDDHIKEKIIDNIPHRNAQHADWAFTQHKKTPLNVNDLHSTLSLFNQHKDKLQKKNIHQYKSFDELKAAVSNFQEKPKEHTVIYDSPTMKVVQHHTHAASVEAAKLQKDNPYYNDLNGKATWCVSADSELGKTHYDTYTNKGKFPFYTIEDKTNKRKYGLVANPLHEKHTVELRDEMDNFPYVSKLRFEYDDERKKDPSHNHIDLFSKNHPEIMNTPLKSFMSGEDHAKATALYNRILSGTHTKKDVDDIFNDPDNKYRAMLIQNHPNDITKKHIDKFMSDYYPNERLATEHLLLHPNFSSEHIDKILKGDDDYYARKVMNNKNVSEDNIKTAIDNKDYAVRMTAIKHPKATQDVFKKVINSTEYDTDYTGKMYHLANHIPHDKMNAETLDHYLQNRHISQDNKIHALKTNKFVTENNVKTAARYGFSDLMIAALQHPLATKELVQKHMTGGSETIRNAAIEEYNKRFSK